MTCPAGQPMHRVEIRQRRDGPHVRYEAPRAECNACTLAPRCRHPSAPALKGRIVDLPLVSTGACVPLLATPADRPLVLAASPSASAVDAPAAGRRRLPIYQTPDPIWTDLPASARRGQLHETLDRQRVDISAPPLAPQAAPHMIERDKRAHRRRTWKEHLARNARGPNAPHVTVDVSGVPAKLARAAGLTLSAA